MPKPLEVIAEQSGDLAANAEVEINRRGKALADEIADNWRKMVDALLGEASKDYLSEVNERPLEVNVDSNINDNLIRNIGVSETANLRMDSAVSGGKVGAVAGGILAAGEVIAGASLGAAIATVFFPVAIVGAVAGFFAYQARKNDRESMAAHVIEIRAELTNQFQTLLTESFEKTSDENCRQLLAAIDQHWPQDTIEKKIVDIDKYLSTASLIPVEYDIDTDERVALSTRRKSRRNEAEALLNSMSDDDDFEEETADV